MTTHYTTLVQRCRFTNSLLADEIASEFRRLENERDDALRRLSRSGEGPPNAGDNATRAGAATREDAGGAQAAQAKCGCGKLKNRPHATCDACNTPPEFAAENEPTRQWQTDGPSGWNLDAAKFVALVQSCPHAWLAFSRMKYIELRIDTRDGGFNLYDRDRQRLNPDKVVTAITEANEKFGHAPDYRTSRASPPQVSAGVTASFRVVRSDSGAFVLQKVTGPTSWEFVSNIKPEHVAALASALGGKEN